MVYASSLSSSSSPSSVSWLVEVCTSVGTKTQVINVETSSISLIANSQSVTLPVLLQEQIDLNFS